MKIEDTDLTPYEKHVLAVSDISARYKQGPLSILVNLILWGTIVFQFCYDYPIFRRPLGLVILAGYSLFVTIMIFLHRHAGMQYRSIVKKLLARIECLEKAGPANRHRGEPG